MASKSGTAEKKDPRQVAIDALVAQMGQVFAGQSSVVGINLKVSATMIGEDGEPTEVLLFESSESPKLKDNGKVGAYLQGKGTDASGVMPLPVQVGCHVTWCKSEKWPR